MNENERNAALDIWGKKSSESSPPAVKLSKYTHVFVWRVGVSKIEKDNITEYLQAVQNNLFIPGDSKMLQYFLPDNGSDVVKLSIVNLETGNVSEL